MATIIPIWRGSVGSHDGSRPYDGATLYSGTVAGSDDAPPLAVQDVIVTASAVAIADGGAGPPTAALRLSSNGYDASASGAANVSARLQATALDQSAVGTANLAARLQASAWTDGALGIPANLQTLTLPAIADGAVGQPAAAQGLTLAAIDAGSVAAANLATRLQASAWADGTLSTPAVLQQLNAPALADGISGQPALSAWLSASALMDGSTGTPAAILPGLTPPAIADGAVGTPTAAQGLTLAAIDAGSVAAANLATRLQASAWSDGTPGIPAVLQQLNAPALDQSAVGPASAALRLQATALADGTTAVPVAALLCRPDSIDGGAIGNALLQYQQMMRPAALDASGEPPTPLLGTRLQPSGLDADNSGTPATRVTLATSAGQPAPAAGKPRLWQARPAWRADWPAPLHPLLPPNRTDLESALADATALNVDPAAIRTLWSADTCPDSHLPWLAWALSVDWWQLAESDDARRALIRSSAALHRKKGTRWAIQEALRVLGFGDCTIQERATGRRYDGQYRYNGTEVHGDPSRWAVYRVTMTRPITNDQAAAIRALLAEVAPARCQLAALDYTAAALRYNGAAHYDNTYTHGVA